jgi:tetratricopeptide (TPR) repeat protein
MEMYDKSLEYFQKAIILSPNDDENYTNRANAYIGLNRLNEAKADLDKALQINKKDEIIYIYYGIIYENKGKINSAKKAYKKALKLNPANNDAREALDYLESHP